ncbi:uncharacterized protein V6R79_022943 [Siganus canaliculatus]
MPIFTQKRLEGKAVCSWQKAPALFGKEERADSDQRVREMPPQAAQSQVKENVLNFLGSFLGIIRILQIVFGAGLWVTIAANKYEGSIHFVLFVAVLFWLLTLALFFLTLLDRQDRVPVLGGDRWLATNLAHDVVAAALYLSAVGIMVYKTDRKSFCNLELYKHNCLYKVYLTATVFAGLCSMAYLLAIIYGACRKCRGERTVI